VSETSGHGPEHQEEPSQRAVSSVADALEPHFIVLDVVTDLRRDVAAVAFPLSIEGAQEAAAQQRRLIDQLDDHLLPRLRELSTPAVVVIAGSTGAGKSTLLNSLLHEEISRASVIRPTTREPVLVFNPQDADAISGTPLVASVRAVSNVTVPRGIALLDAPDLDSVLDDNREIASRLLEGADLWLFVTTAARYGDALPWRALEGAMRRGATVAMVLNRAPKNSLATVRADLLNRLREHHMENAPLFIVPDAGPHEGLLEASDVAPIERWLRTLGGVDRARTVILRTLRGSLIALPPWVEDVAEHIETQLDAAKGLGIAAEESLRPVVLNACTAIESGALAQGAVQSRWSYVVGPARLERSISRSGVAKGSARRGRAREAALESLAAAVHGAATATLTAAADDARAALRAALADLPGGVELAPASSTEASDDQAVRVDVDGWCAGARGHIDAIDVTGSKQNAAAVRAFGRGGLTALLLASAVGVVEATDLLGRVLGNVGHELGPKLTGQLADIASTVVERELDSVRTALAVPALADDAAVGLRVRLAELAQLT
jgi:GTPase SAR1 family protein